MMLNQQCSAILAALPVDADHDAAQRILIYCAKSIAGGIDWPSSIDIDELRAIPGGFGCWFADIQHALDTASLDPAAVDIWQVAWNGCKAMLMQLHLVQRQSAGHGRQKP